MSACTVCTIEAHHELMYECLECDRPVCPNCADETQGYCRECSFWSERPRERKELERLRKLSLATPGRLEAEGHDSEEILAHVEKLDRVIDQFCEWVEAGFKQLPKLA